MNLLTLVMLFHPYVVAATVSCRRFYSLCLHANVKLDFGPLSYLLVSPRFHRWHHSDSEAATNKNYAVYFSFFDWIFGTCYLPKGELPYSYGLHQDGIGERFILQMSHPFATIASFRSRSMKDQGWQLSTNAD